MMAAPSRSDVHDRLMRLLRGETPRERVAGWAKRWVSLDDPGVADRAVWSALKHLAGADLLSEPGQYLHGEDDIHAWIDELESQGDIERPT